jgi:hypothetical protein
MPTLAALAGVDAPTGLHGVDLRLSAGQRGPGHALAFSSNGDASSVNYTAYDADCRLTWYPAAGFTELFDHRTDPAEEKNVAASPAYAGRVEALRALLCRRLAELTNPILGRVSAW